MSYVCQSCGSVISNQKFNEYQRMQSENKGCGCFLFGLACLFCMTLVLIPIAILLFILINKKENVSECPYCHAKNCLIPANTPMARKILKENYSDEEIKELKEQEINGFNEEKTKKFSLIGCIWFVVGMYLIIIILGLIFSGK